MTDKRYRMIQRTIVYLQVVIVGLTFDYLFWFDHSFHSLSWHVPALAKGLCLPLGLFGLWISWPAVIMLSAIRRWRVGQRNISQLLMPALASTVVCFGQWVIVLTQGFRYVCGSWKTFP